MTIKLTFHSSIASVLHSKYSLTRVQECKVERSIPGSATLNRKRRSAVPVPILSELPSACSIVEPAYTRTLYGNKNKNCIVRIHKLNSGTIPPTFDRIDQADLNVPYKSEENCSPGIYWHKRSTQHSLLLLLLYIRLISTN
ncbi:hypothetical protein J6590_040616 [Homalodisca vitripennis]|nr:hypothetical protein J6590_040616 [Homalodisca vitripennis]